MAKISEYRDKIRDSLDTAGSNCIDTIEADVNEIIEFAEGIDKADAEEMTDGLETIIADLKELAEKLY